MLKLYFSNAKSYLFLGRVRDMKALLSMVTVAAGVGVEVAAGVADVAVEDITEEE
jgi:hypothetical protein